MKKKVLAVMLCAVMAISMLAGCGSSKEEGKTDSSEGTKTEDSGDKDSGDKYKVVLITMDSIDQHWVSVDKGAKKAADELGNVDYKFMAPDKKDDAQQIECVNNAVADGAQAIVIAANGPDAVTAALEEAKAAGVKIVYVDSTANTDAEATFSTDNIAAAETAGKEMIKALETKGIKEGKIGVVNVNTSTMTCIWREEGFRNAFKGSKFEILETQYGDGDVAKSQDIASNYITDGCVGVYGTNEGATVGVGNAVKDAGKDIIAVGFDKSDAIINLVKDGAVLCTMAQNPDVMGYEGLKAAVKVLEGETLTEKEVDTGVSVITKDTL